MKLMAEEVSAGYGARTVIEKLSISVPKGRMLSLIGPNGSGKSTVLKTLARLLKPSNGTVLLEGKDIACFERRHLARRLSLLPQAHTAPDGLCVIDFVSYGRFPHSATFGGFTRKDREAVERALSLTRLEGLAGRRLSTLSGGERQRAWLALSLAQEPDTMLLDEPTSSLDIRYQCEMLELICGMNRALGLTIVMVLHDLNLASRCSHWMAAIKDGKVFREGPPSEIVTPELIEEVFGVKARVLRDNGAPYFIPKWKLGEEDPI